MPNKNKYNTAELVAVLSSRVLENNKVVFVGAGLPLISAALAQRTHAPNLRILFEGGIISPEILIGGLPLSTNESRAAYKAVMLPSPTDLFSLQQRGYIDYGFLGGAQIDKFGNLNTSFIGDSENPKVRLPGSGGGNDIITSCTKTIIATHHEKRRFVEKVDFITSPGYLNGNKDRENSGLIFGKIYKVITHLAIFEFDEKSKLMKLAAIHPGVEVNDVIENTGFKPIIPKNVARTKAPTDKELKILRELDPDQRYTSER